MTPSRGCPNVEAEYENQSPAEGSFSAVVADEDALREAVAQVSWRWRLDITKAIEDIADAL
jgi:hypothetical protein